MSELEASCPSYTVRGSLSEIFRYTRTICIMYYICILAAFNDHITDQKSAINTSVLTVGISQSHTHEHILSRAWRYFFRKCPKKCAWFPSEIQFEFREKSGSRNLGIRLAPLVGILHESRYLSVSNKIWCGSYKLRLDFVFVPCPENRAKKWLKIKHLTNYVDF